ncbi:MAG: outer membrane protein [Desulforhopalus sp.]|jgi:outer membrane protein
MKSEIIVFVFFFYSFLVFSIPVLAADIVAENSRDARNHRSPKNLTEIKGPQWGVGFGLRYASTSFVGEDNTNSDVIPMFYYEGERLFVRGLEAGTHLCANGQFKFDLFTRYRFFDYPKEFEDDLDRYTFDVGLRSSREVADNTNISAEILTDFYGRFHATGRIDSTFSGNFLGNNIGTKWWLIPLLEVRGKSSSFNSRYYGLGIDNIDAGVDLRAALKYRLHVWSNLYLEGLLEARLLDNTTQKSAVVEESVEYMAYISIGFFEEPKNETSNTLKATPYFRLSQGWGSNSSLAHIFQGEIRKDDVEVNMTSLFYGHPLSDTLFGLPIEIYITPGLAHHYSSDVQGAATEIILGFKFFYTIPLPWRVRFGATEGISYIDSITYYEDNSIATDNFSPSRLLNYVDLSIDVNIGDILHSTTLKDLWLGYAIHHRSGIGGSSTTFGNLSGGSNYNTLYFQWSVGF